MRNKAKNPKRFMRILTLPYKVLCKARDLYVKTMTDYGERVSCGGGGGSLSTLQKSFSVSSSTSKESEDLRELIRVLSTNRSLGNRVDLDLFIQQEMRQAMVRGSRRVPRSCSVGMGRIDEDGPCDFGGQDFSVKKELMYPRSRSYAVPKRNVVF